MRARVAAEQERSGAVVQAGESIHYSDAVVSWNGRQSLAWNAHCWVVENNEGSLQEACSLFIVSIALVLVVPG